MAKWWDGEKVNDDGVMLTFKGWRLTVWSVNNPMVFGKLVLLIPYRHKELYFSSRQMHRNIIIWQHTQNSPDHMTSSSHRNGSHYLFITRIRLHNQLRDYWSSSFIKCTLLDIRYNSNGETINNFGLTCIKLCQLHNFTGLLPLLSP